MAKIDREELATQVDAELLSAIRSLAQSEGRQIQVLIEEALADLVEKRKHGRPRADVMAAYQESHKAYGSLYKKLAE